MRSVVPTLAVAALVLLAGCGSSSSAPKPNGEASKTATQVLKDAQNSLRQASSVHISGTGALESVPHRQFHFNATSVTDKGGTASATLGDVAFKVVRIGDEVYVRGNKAFTDSLASRAGRFSGSVASTLTGRWLKCPSSTVVGGRGGLTDAPSFLSPMYSRGTPRNKGETTRNGEKVVEIDTGRYARLYVAATGTPYPLALVAYRQAITFDDFNATVTLTAPKNAIAALKFCGL